MVNRGLNSTAKATESRVLQRGAGIGQAVRMLCALCVVLNPCTELSVRLSASPVSDVLPRGSVPCSIHYTWDATMSRCIQVGHVQHSTACGTMEFW